MDLKLQGRSAVITGGSKGIGFAIGRWFASEGCGVSLVARSAEELQRAAAAIAGEHKVEVQTFALDLSQPEAREQLVAARGDADILVNNAGAIPGGNLEEIDDATWRAAWDLKVFGYVNLSRAFYARMKAKQRGVILNIIGAAGERLDAAYIAGSTGNAALMAFTRALGAASVKDGIRVLGINPGPVETERLERLTRKRAADTLGDPDRWRELLSKFPFARGANVDEIAATAVFLASDLSAYTSGTIVTIDGGIANRAAFG